MHAHKVLHKHWGAQSERRCSEPFSLASLEPGIKWCRLQLVYRFHGIREPGRLLAHTLAFLACIEILLQNPKYAVGVQFGDLDLAILDSE